MTYFKEQSPEIRFRYIKHDLYPTGINPIETTNERACRLMEDLDRLEPFILQSETLDGTRKPKDQNVIDLEQERLARAKEKRDQKLLAELNKIAEMGKPFLGKKIQKSF